MRKALVGVLVTLCLSTSALAEVRVNIGINVPSYPRLVAVPGYPVYYAPGLNSNYFFYDGLYWVLEGDAWYSSSWYNGPWHSVSYDALPVYLLRVPVRYYRHPPTYFRGWHRDMAPRWGEHWGRDWEGRHRGWDSRDRQVRVAPAPLPSYQRQFSGDRYPHAGQQAQLHSNQYRWQPRDQVVREHFQQQGIPARAERAQERRDDRGGDRGRGHDR